MLSVRTNLYQIHRPVSCPLVRTSSLRISHTCYASAASIQSTDEVVGLLKNAAAKPGSVPPSEVLKAVVSIEKARCLTKDWSSIISAPGKRWRLVYTADSKDVQAAIKGRVRGKGLYFPLSACQKFGSDETFENGVFLGPLGHLTFKGPCATKDKQLSFDVHTMYIGLGPWRFSLPLKKDGKPLSQVDPKEVRKLPFFLYAYVDEDIIVARGRSGGLALWVAADAKWQADSGVLQVLK